MFARRRNVNNNNSDHRILLAPMRNSATKKGSKPTGQMSTKCIATNFMPATCIFSLYSLFMPKNACTPSRLASVENPTPLSVVSLEFRSLGLRSSLLNLIFGYAYA